MISIIIPARDEKYLQTTIDDINNRISGEFEYEIIVALDGCWPNPSINRDKNVSLVHFGGPKGIRYIVEAAIRIAKYEHIMKLDAHCSLAKDFDKVLIADTEDNWISIPSRYSLNEKSWKKTRGPVDYMMITYPYADDDKYGWGIHGKKWRGENGQDGNFWHLEKKRKNILIDDIIIFQGSCWFMHKQHFWNIGGYEKSHPYIMFQEAPELSFKTWLSGGRVVRNKKTWFAHMHKSKEQENTSSYGLSKRKKYEAEDWSADFWMNDRWDKSIHKFSWLIEKFSPMYGWEDIDWNQEFKMNRGG